jgi:hypothetical protein
LLHNEYDYGPRDGCRFVNWNIDGSEDGLEIKIAFIT